MGNCRWLRDWASALVGLVLATILIVHTSLTLLPETPRGVQCPTAAVQAIPGVSYVRDCCGKLVARTTLHTPREGEPGFLQCRCAEKKAAETQQKTDAAVSSRGSTVVALLSPRFEFIGWMVLMPIRQAHAYLAPTHYAPAFAPPTPPPQLISSLNFSSLPR